MNDNEFSVEAIMAAAQAEAGLDDFGGEEFIEPFRRLVASHTSESSLSSQGRLTLRNAYEKLLVNRLRAERDFKEHPEIFDEEILPPIVVVGLPRSGTTKLQRVLCSHPDLQPLAHWRLMNPAPFPDSQGAVPDPRIAYAEQVIGEHFTDLLGGHPMSAMDPEEELLLMELTFDAPTSELRCNVPSYYKWRWQQSMIPCYRYLYRMLQYLQWQQADEKCRPYLLKSPMHLGHIRDFLTVFPQATIAHCHRDPLESVASFARLTELGWGMVSTIKDKQVFGNESMRVLSTHMDRYLEQRRAIEQDAASKAKFVDVKFEQLVTNAITVAADILDRHDGDVEMTEAAESHILQWEKDNPPTKFGEHEYTLEEFGLSKDAIQAAFSEYYQQYLS